MHIIHASIVVLFSRFRTIVRIVETLKTHGVAREPTNAELWGSIWLALILETRYEVSCSEALGSNLLAARPQLEICRLCSRSQSTFRRIV